MGRAFVVVMGLACVMVSCSAQVTIEPFDAGADALPPCDGLAVCETDNDCAGEQFCSTESCMSDKDTTTHWCVCKPPNPGPVGCNVASDCPPPNVCWSWACEQSYCTATPNQ
jgi:hypothetical protein